MGKQADELVVAMNRAAEMAVPEAKKLLIEAVKKMSIQDAKAIISGGDDAATAYFRKNTRGCAGGEVFAHGEKEHPKGRPCAALQ